MSDFPKFDTDHDVAYRTKILAALDIAALASFDTAIPSGNSTKRMKKLILYGVKKIE